MDCGYGVDENCNQCMEGYLHDLTLVWNYQTCFLPSYAMPIMVSIVIIITLVFIEYSRRLTFTTRNRARFSLKISILSLCLVGLFSVSIYIDGLKFGYTSGLLFALFNWFSWPVLNGMNSYSLVIVTFSVAGKKPAWLDRTISFIWAFFAVLWILSYTLMVLPDDYSFSLLVFSSSSTQQNNRVLLLICTAILQIFFSIAFSVWASKQSRKGFNIKPSNSFLAATEKTASMKDIIEEAATAANGGSNSPIPSKSTPRLMPKDLSLRSINWAKSLSTRALRITSDSSVSSEDSMMESQWAIDNFVRKSIERLNTEAPFLPRPDSADLRKTVEAVLEERKNLKSRTKSRKVLTGAESGGNIKFQNDDSGFEFGVPENAIDIQKIIETVINEESNFVRSRSKLLKDLNRTGSKSQLNSNNNSANDMSSGRSKITVMYLRRGEKLRNRTLFCGILYVSACFAWIGLLVSQSFIPYQFLIWFSLQMITLLQIHCCTRFIRPSKAKHHLENRNKSPTAMMGHLSAIVKRKTIPSNNNLPMKDDGGGRKLSDSSEKKVIRRGTIQDEDEDVKPFKDGDEIFDVSNHESNSSPNVRKPSKRISTNIQLVGNSPTAGVNKLKRVSMQEMPTNITSPTSGSAGLGLESNSMVNILSTDELAVTNSPSSSITGSTLLAGIRDRETLEKILQVCIELKMDESARFLLAIQDFQNEKGKKARIALGHEIMAKFINENAPMELNISPILKEKVRKLDSGFWGLGLASSFDEIVLEVWNDLKFVPQIRPILKAKLNSSPASRPASLVQKNSKLKLVESFKL